MPKVAEQGSPQKVDYVGFKHLAWLILFAGLPAAKLRPAGGPHERGIPGESVRSEFRESPAALSWWQNCY